MRSSDPTESLVFLGLKRILIIAFQSGSGPELLYYEHLQRSHVKWSTKAASTVAEGARFKEMSSMLHQFHYDSLSLSQNSCWILHWSFYRTCMLNQCEVKCHLWSNSRRLADFVPQQQSGWRTSCFYQWYPKLYVSFSQLVFLLRLTVQSYQSIY